MHEIKQQDCLASTRPNHFSAASKIKNYTQDHQQFFEQIATYKLYDFQESAHPLSKPDLKCFHFNDLMDYISLLPVIALEIKR
jgi:hypothetical protein